MVHFSRMQNILFIPSLSIMFLFPHWSEFRDIIRVCWQINILNVGIYELWTKKHRWIQHRQHFTWFSWWRCKLCTDGGAVYWPKYAVVYPMKYSCYLILINVHNVILNLFFFQILGSTSMGILGRRYFLWYEHSLWLYVSVISSRSSVFNLT